MPRKKKDSNNSTKPKNAYFLSFELENVRCFSERQRIDFSDGNGKPKQWTIILGDNGTGKTTLLKLLVGMTPVKQLNQNGKEEVRQRYNKILDEIEHHYYCKREAISLDEIKNVLKNKNESGFFENIIKSGSGLTLEIAFQHKLFQQQVGTLFEIVYAISKLNELVTISIYGNDAKSRDSFKYRLIDWVDNSSCFAYGASRKIGETSLSEKNDDGAYKTLFDEKAFLINPEEWFLQADYASKRASSFAEKRKYELELVKRILIGNPPSTKGALPDITDIRFLETESGRTPKPIVEFHTPYGWVEAKDLSLGYRTSMAWMVDFASRMFDLYPESENPLAEPAVVLIDEIDLHLHPKWQRELIDYLTNLFPNTQFIVTTHSPLIVQAAAARDANIVVCRREGDHVVIDQSVEAVKNWRADQILTSELFDLPTARPKEIEKDLFERQKILSKAKLTKKDERRLKELEDEIGFMPVGETPEEDKAMDIIRRAAERLQSDAK